jgi:dihydrofolate reductase
MGRVVVINHLTLDGVMQAPGRPDEDTRGGFTHGGWSVPNVDNVMMDVVLGTRTTASGGLLLGRRSYEDMLGYWNTQDSPFKDMLNNAPKYVASRTLREPLPWPNSTLLQGDVAAAVALKRRSEVDLTVMGSGEFDPNADAPQPDRRVPTPHPPTRARHRSPSLHRRWAVGLASPCRRQDQHNRRSDRNVRTGELNLRSASVRE